MGQDGRGWLLRWSAVAFVETEKHYRRVTGYQHLWMLKAHLDRDDNNIAEMQKVGELVFIVAVDLLYYRWDTLADPARREEEADWVFVIDAVTPCLHWA